MARRSPYLVPALALLASLARAELPVVRVDEVLKSGAGGAFTVAAVGMVQGRKTFLKSNRGMKGMRSANFEADLVATRLFERLGVKAPGTAVVRLAADSPLREELGEVVLAMEFVDEAFAGGEVTSGAFPRDGSGDLDQLADLFVVDALLGNADRRTANFFLGRRPEVPLGTAGARRPLPIDNNAALGSLVCWTSLTSHSNFLPTYDGLGIAEVFRDLGTLRAVVAEAPSHDILLATPANHPRVRARVRRAVDRLDDAFLREVAAAIPAAVIPPGTVLDPAEFVPLADFLGPELFRVAFPAGKRLEGEALVRYRRGEVLQVLRWRRDHLAAALEAYLEYRRSDPEERERWETMKVWYGLD